MFDRLLAGAGRAMAHLDGNDASEFVRSERARHELRQVVTPDGKYVPDGAAEVPSEEALPLRGGLALHARPALPLVTLTYPEAEALEAVVMGDAFDTELIDSARAKIQVVRERVSAE